jgi:hypothetical protein
VTTYKTYHGTHQGPFLGVEATGRRIHFETVDAMRVRNGQIIEHWGVTNLFSLLQQLGALPTRGPGLAEGAVTLTRLCPIFHVGEKHYHRALPGPIGAARNRWCGLPVYDVVRRIDVRIDPSAP